MEHDTAMNEYTPINGIWDKTVGALYCPDCYHPLVIGTGHENGVREARWVCHHCKNKYEGLIPLDRVDLIERIEELETRMQHYARHCRRLVKLEAALEKIRDAQLWGHVLDPNYDHYEAQREFTKKLQDIASRALEGGAS